MIFQLDAPENYSFLVLRLSLNVLSIPIKLKTHKLECGLLPKKPSMWAQVLPTANVFLTRR